MRHPFDHPRTDTPSKPARYAVLDRVTDELVRRPVHALRRRPRPSFDAARLRRFWARKAADD